MYNPQTHSISTIIGGSKVSYFGTNMPEDELYNILNNLGITFDFNMLDSSILPFGTDSCYIYANYDKDKISSVDLYTDYYSGDGVDHVVKISIYPNGEAEVHKINGKLKDNVGYSGSKDFFENPDVYFAEIIEQN